MNSHEGEPGMLRQRREEVADLVDRLTAWARDRPEVRGLALAGSYARGTERLDSDVDVVLLTDEPERFTKSVEWLDVLGGPPIFRSGQFGVITERRVKLPSGLEIEFGIGPVSWGDTDSIDLGTRQVVEQGFRVLHDPDGLLTKLQAAVGSGRER